MSQTFPRLNHTFSEHRVNLWDTNPFSTILADAAFDDHGDAVGVECSYDKQACPDESNSMIDPSASQALFPAVSILLDNSTIPS